MLTDKRSTMNTSTLKLYCSLLLGGMLLTAVQWGKSSYDEMFATLNLDTRAYDEVYVMHFDFCSTATKCRDTVELGAYLNNPNKRVALVVDTMHSSYLPAYVKIQPQHIYYINRQWMQRRGIYTAFQQQLKIARSGKLKRRILLR